MEKNFKTEITKIHYNKDAKGAVFKVLKFASLFYGIGSGLKNFLYDKKLLTPRKVEARVISIGNITTGGVGKTPVVCELAKYLKSKGENVAIVSRGYGGKLSNKNINVISDSKEIFYNAQMAGDEPFWLAKNTGCAVVTSKSRYNAAKYAVENFGATVILLDDGFQHRKLHRDIDIVLMDSVKGFGNENLLPAGPLREGLEAFNRIDKFVIVSKSVDHKRAEKLAKIMSKKMKVETSICKVEPDYIYNIENGEIIDKAQSATALCAIGQPEQFFEFLKDYDIKEKITFDDHHQYTPDDIKNISGPIITTEKDAVKLLPFGFDNIYALKLKTCIDVAALL
ncbi:tetraacyldisaccharide 4'-kinase [bacterium]|nr:tetraacyldisaccharide 4'-kinase [bacterium]